MGDDGQASLGTLLRTETSRVEHWHKDRRDLVVFPKIRDIHNIVDLERTPADPSRAAATSSHATETNREGDAGLIGRARLRPVQTAQ
jgi:hypothetical protein